MKALADKPLFNMISALYQFWHSYGSDVQSGAVVLSAITGFLIIHSARATSRRRATLDLVLHQESDRDLIHARNKFNELKAGATKLVTFASAESRNSEQVENIRKILNLHELTAVAIQEGVIDEKVYRRWFNGTFISDYEACKAFIVKARKTYQNEHIFIEFERAALRWQADLSWYAAPGWLARKKAALARVRRA